MIRQDLNEYGAPVLSVWCPTCKAHPKQMCGAGLYYTERPRTVCRSRMKRFEEVDAERGMDVSDPEHVPSLCEAADPSERESYSIADALGDHRPIGEFYNGWFWR